MDISDKIKLIREFIGLTQEQFALALDTTRAIVRDYETSKSKPKRIILDKIAALISTTYTRLIADSFEVNEVIRPTNDLIDTLNVYNLYNRYKNITDKKQEILNGYSRPVFGKALLSESEVFEQQKDIESRRGFERSFRQKIVDNINYNSRNDFKISDADIDAFNFFKIVELFNSLNQFKPNIYILKSIKERYKLPDTVIADLSGIALERLNILFANGYLINSKEGNFFEIIDNRLSEISEHEIEKQYHNEIFQSLKYGLLIKRRREESSMSQQELAAEVNLPEQSISDIEKGHFSLSDTTLQPLWDYFKITLPDVIYNEGEPVEANKIFTTNYDKYLSSVLNQMNGERKPLSQQKFSRPKKFIGLMTLVLHGEQLFEIYQKTLGNKKEKDLDSTEEKQFINTVKGKINDIASEIYDVTGKPFKKPDDINLDYILSYAIDNFDPFFMDETIEEIKDSYAVEMIKKNEEIEVYIREIYKLKKQINELSMVVDPDLKKHLSKELQEYVNSK